MNLTPQQTEIFWSWVDIKGKDECWIWKGSPAGSMGYGRIRFNNKSYQAHRIAYLLTFGSLPDPKMDTCHSCDNPLCVNPRHISECTRKKNMQEAVLRGRINTQKLTVEDVLAIRASKEKQNRLAIRFGVRESTISRIKNRRAWAFLP